MWKLFFALRRRKEHANKSVSEKSAVGALLDQSPGPAILTFILVWGVAAVLLTLSATRQRDIQVWNTAQKAPFTVRALTAFDYIDSEATAGKRNEERAKVPEYFRISRAGSEFINQNFYEFFQALRARAAAEESKTVYRPADSRMPGKLAAGFENFSELLFAVRRQGGLEQFEKTLDRLVRHGIMSEHSDGNSMDAKLIRVLTNEGREIEIAPRSVESAAGELVLSLDPDVEKRSPNSSGFRLSASCADEFRKVVISLLGHGNLDFDHRKTVEMRNVAARAVKNIVKHCDHGEVIVEKNGTVTAQVLDMLKAESAAAPQSVGFSVFYYRIAISFLLLVFAFFLLYNTYPDIFRSSSHFAIGGALLVLSLIANYEGIQLFYHLFRQGIIRQYSMLPNMVPVSLCAALFAVLLGNRAAMFGVFTVACLTSLMVAHEQSLGLVIRWFFGGILVAFAVRNVTNYRSFFVRVFLVGAVSNVLISGDMILARPEHFVLDHFWAVTLLNSFSCAVAALLLVFGFELFFNTDTNMSLMVLCDYNHPLFEKLKREAPGTMFHSITVATLAEDAARAIKANPLKTKAGALFHDIGKLLQPEYFVENNVDSPSEYEKLPPEKCCSIIREHVNDGLSLAKEYRLSRFLREAIASHHGDDLVSFFYNRALKEAEANPDAPEVHEEDFHYAGHPPVGKELTIISLADACEAACRSLNRPGVDEIRKMVSDIFINRLRNGQLRYSNLTLRELETVKECFITDLAGFNHGRIAYKKEKLNG